MLQAIRDKSHGIFAWVMLIFVGIPFGLWGINNYFNGGKEKPIAEVGNREILEKDLGRAYQDLTSRMGNADYDEKELKHQALEQLINDELITQDAQNLGLVVAENDVRDYVYGLPFFQTDGRFDTEKLKMMLASQGMSSPQFSSQVAKQLLTEQYIKGVSDSAIVTKRQLEDFYRLRNQERLIDYFTLPLRPSTLPVADADIETYYQAHKDEFQNPEKVSVEYLSLSIDDVSGNFQATEEDLKSLYEEQKAQFGTPERRKVSQILIAAETDKEESIKAAQAKAEALRQRLVQGEDFARLAKDSSDDKDSGDKGGDMGFVNKEALDPNFSKAAFALAKDEISQPVKTPFGFHLIKVTELVPATTKSFAEVRAELEKNFRRNAAENKFYEAKQKLAELSFEHSDGLEALAAALQLKSAQTGPFTRDAGEGVAAEAAVRNAAFTQEVLDGKNSEALEIGDDKVYVLHMKEHILPTDKPLSEVKDAITAKLHVKQAEETLRRQGEQLVAEIKQGKSFEDAAKSAGVPVVKASVKLVGKADLPLALSSAVNKAPIPRGGRASPLTAKLETGDLALFRVNEVKEGTTTTVEPKELEMAKDYLVKNEGQGELNAYMETLRQKIKVQINAQDSQQ